MKEEFGLKINDVVILKLKVIKFRDISSICLVWIIVTLWLYVFIEEIIS